jgi:hypothetical protein
MRWKSLIAIPVCAAVLGGCFELQPTKEQAQLMDAMIFAVYDVEENTTDKFTLIPWKRDVRGEEIELHTVRNNSIFWSDEETNRKTRPSKYIRYSYHISTPEKCVFRIRRVDEWSQGASETEFTAYTSAEDIVLDLNKAYRFEIDLRGPDASVHFEGPAVMCRRDVSWCQNSWSHQIFPVDYYSYGVRSPSVQRRDKAIELLKKACPGKPY